MEGWSWGTWVFISIGLGWFITGVVMRIEMHNQNQNHVCQFLQIEIYSLELTRW